MQPSIPEITASAEVDRNDIQYEICTRQGLRYAAALLRNRSDAEEAVQEAFCRLQTGEPPCDVDNYRARFFATLRNHCIDRIRRRRIRREVGMDPEVEKTNGSPTRRLESNEIICSVEVAINQLPDDWKQALQLRVFAELSYDEIAGIMKLTRNQVRTWIYRARRQLAEKLTSNGILDSVET